MTGSPVQFLLGTHQPGWLARAGVPLFVSDTRLRRYRTLPVAVAAFGVDPGGFTELQRFGTWTVSPREYVARLRRYRDEIGNLLWAAPQDWMCEDLIINGGWAHGQRFVGTRLSVAEHQRRTVLNYDQLSTAPTSVDAKQNSSTSPTSRTETPGRSPHNQVSTTTPPPIGD